MIWGNVPGPGIKSALATCIIFIFLSYFLLGVWPQQLWVIQAHRRGVYKCWLHAWTSLYWTWSTRIDEVQNCPHHSYLFHQCFILFFRLVACEYSLMSVILCLALQSILLLLLLVHASVTLGTLCFPGSVTFTLAGAEKWLSINGSANVNTFTNKKKCEIEFVACECLTVSLNPAGTAVVISLYGAQQ